MMKKVISIMLISALCVLPLAGCGGSSSAKNYKDGTYTADSSVFTNDDGTDDGNGYGTITITIEDNVITACEYKSYETDGTLKDEEYGKEQGEVQNRDSYTKAQRAVAACDEYAKQLVESGSVDGVDAISGATHNYEQFCESLEIALKSAEAD